jgi:hypothetical protein
VRKLAKNVLSKELLESTPRAIFHNAQISKEFFTSKKAHVDLRCHRKDFKVPAKEAVLLSLLFTLFAKLSSQAVARSCSLTQQKI